MTEITHRATGPQEQPDGTWRVRGDGWTVEGLGRPWQPEPLSRQDADSVWGLRWYIGRAAAGKGASRLCVEPGTAGDGGVWDLESCALIGFLWT